MIQSATDDKAFWKSTLGAESNIGIGAAENVSSNHRDERFQEQAMDEGITVGGAMSANVSVSDSIVTLPPEEWVEAYGDYLFNYAVSRLRDNDAAEEVVQETLLAGIRAQSQFARHGSQRGWLMAIMKRKIIDFVRRRTKYGRDSETRPNADATDDLFKANGFWKKGAATWSAIPEGDMEASELWKIVSECLKGLPDGQADVFALSVLEELETEQICSDLGITANNLWVRLHRARLRLAVCVGAKWNVEPNDVG